MGDFSVDILVEDSIILELKSVEKLIKAHEVQLANYLTALKKDVGLLINFGPSGVNVKRKYRKFIRQDQSDKIELKTKNTTNPALPSKNYLTG